MNDWISNFHLFGFGLQKFLVFAFTNYFSQLTAPMLIGSTSRRVLRSGHIFRLLSTTPPSASSNTTPIQSKTELFSSKLSNLSAQCKKSFPTLTKSDVESSVSKVPPTQGRYADTFRFLSQFKPTDRAKVLCTEESKQDLRLLLQVLEHQWRSFTPRNQATILHSLASLSGFLSQQSIEIKPLFKHAAVSFIRLDTEHLLGFTSQGIYTPPTHIP